MESYLSCLDCINTGDINYHAKNKVEDKKGERYKRKMSNVEFSAHVLV